MVGDGEFMSNNSTQFIPQEFGRSLKVVGVNYVSFCSTNRSVKIFVHSMKQAQKLHNKALFICHLKVSCNLLRNVPCNPKISSCNMPYKNYGYTDMLVPRLTRFPLALMLVCWISASPIKTPVLTNSNHLKQIQTNIVLLKLQTS